MNAAAYFDLQIKLASLSLDVRGGAVVPELAAVAAALREAESANASLPSQALQRRLGLSDQAMRAVWVLAAAAVDAGYRAKLAARIGGELVTADALADVAYDGSRQLAMRELGCKGTLRRLAVIERSDGRADVHESRRTWTIARRIVAWLHGDTGLDAELAPLCRASEPRAFAELALAAGVENAACEAARAGRAVVIASGSSGLGRRSVLVAAAHAAGRSVLEIDARLLSDDAVVIDGQLAAIVRECRLADAAPLVRDLDALDAAQLRSVGEHIAELAGVVFATSSGRAGAVRWDRPVIEVSVPPPPSSVRGKLWIEALGVEGEGDAELLATQYPLAPALIRRAAEAACAHAADRAIAPHDVEAGVRSVLDDRLAGLARRIDVTQTWDDLVLPDDHLLAVRELVARVRRRRTVYEDWGFAAKLGKGLGVSALFSGPPGTGKTMLASLIARELGIELYAADTSKLVSKFIGETEKHLAALFDAAEAGHAILLFDEADSLFGKRTDVRTSNDRYANLETNYLLQRLESFTGICILTSNHEANIDPAFQRRLSLHLRLELPNANERAALWRAMLPESAPREARIDYSSLARRFEMSGGYIRNAAVRAAFLAADDEVPISDAHLHHAALVEYEGMGKIAAL